MALTEADIVPLMQQCARCGGEADTLPRYGNDWPQYTVRCVDCGRSGPRCTTIKAAVVVWNEDQYLLRHAMADSGDGWATPD